VNVTGASSERCPRVSCNVRRRLPDEKLSTRSWPFMGDTLDERFAIAMGRSPASLGIGYPTVLGNGMPRPTQQITELEFERKHRAGRPQHVWSRGRIDLSLGPRPVPGEARLLFAHHTTGSTCSSCGMGASRSLSSASCVPVTPSHCSQAVTRSESVG